MSPSSTDPSVLDPSGLGLGDYLSTDYTSTDATTAAANPASGSSGGFFSGLGSTLSSGASGLLGFLGAAAPLAGQVYSATQSGKAQQTAAQIAAANAKSKNVVAQTKANYLPWILGGSVGLLLIVLFGLMMSRRGKN